MPQAEHTQKPGRAQLKHLLLDVNFKDKPKVIELEAVHSPLARLLYIDIQATMSAATNARISKRVPLVLGARIGLSPEQVNTIIEYCIQNEMLIEEDEQLTSKRVIEDQEKLYKDQERWRQNREKQKKSTDINISYARAEHVPDVRKSEQYTDLNICRSEDLNIDPNKIKVLDFLYFDQISIDTWRAKLGVKQFERACEKLNGWIGQAKGTAEFQSRKNTGKNASFALQNWVSNAVLNEKSEKPKAQDPPRPKLKPVVMPWEEPDFKPMKL